MLALRMQPRHHDDHEQRRQQLPVQGPADAMLDANLDDRLFQVIRQNRGIVDPTADPPRAIADIISSNSDFNNIPFDPLADIARSLATTAAAAATAATTTATTNMTSAIMPPTTTSSMSTETATTARTTAVAHVNPNPIDSSCIAVVNNMKLTNVNHLEYKNDTDMFSLLQPLLAQQQDGQLLAGPYVAQQQLQLQPDPFAAGGGCVDPFQPRQQSMDQYPFRQSQSLLSDTQQGMAPSPRHQQRQQQQRRQGSQLQQLSETLGSLQPDLLPSQHNQDFSSRSLGLQLPQQQKQQQQPVGSLPFVAVNEAKVGTPSTPVRQKMTVAQASSVPGHTRFRSYQADLWNRRFAELIDFKRRFKHCDVPYSWAENQPLAQWVKRQRYQYRLRKMGKNSTLTPERHGALESLDFNWDYHEKAWDEKLAELRAFQTRHGHSNVPSKYPQNPQLSVWVKRQRRQYQLFANGINSSTMTADRVRKLQAIGFDFEMCEGTTGDLQGTP